MRFVNGTLSRAHGRIGEQRHAGMAIVRPVHALAFAAHHQQQRSNVVAQCFIARRRNQAAFAVGLHQPVAPIEEENLVMGEDAMQP